MSNNFRHYGIMIDSSRNAVMKPEAVKQMNDLLEKMGYNSLMLYTEDTYEVNNQPYFGYLRGRYTKEEIKELDAYGRERGVELIPCIQTLAHLNAIMRWSYSNYCDTGDILCVGEDKTYELIEDMFATINECFTSKIINIGMDEAEMIGRGKYLQKNGYRERVDIFMEHLVRVSEIAKKYDFTLCMWSDMFYRMTAGKYENFQGKHEIDKSITEKIPENVKLIYWDYYSVDEKHYDDMIENHQMLQKDIWFAGGLWTWAGYAPHNTYGIKSSMDIVDRQCVAVQFANGSIGTLNMVGGASIPDRHIHIICEYGEIVGYIGSNKITVRVFNKEKIAADETCIDFSAENDLGEEDNAVGGHYGGDYYIMKDLVRFLNGEATSVSTTVIEDSVNSHLICYAAEKARKEKVIVDLKEEYAR